MTHELPGTPEEMRSALGTGQWSAPPPLPDSWTATALLTPYGQYRPAMASYNQLAVARIAYDRYDDERIMTVGLYLLEDLKCFEFSFVTSGQTTKWAWIKGKPGAPKSSLFGPFATTLVVPEPDFLADTSYWGQWPLLSQFAGHWLALTRENEGQRYGSWFAFNSMTNALIRVINIPADNAMRLPFLGAYFMAQIVDFEARPRSDRAITRARALTGADGGDSAVAPEAVAFDNPMRTQVDIVDALARPLWSEDCTLEEIRTLIPGIEPLPDWPLPKWSETVKITGMTLGQNTMPYYTQVYYSNPLRRQRSQFVGWGPSPEKESYDYRQDTVLYSDYFNDVQYVYEGDGNWRKLSCARVSGIGYPRPNFPERDHAVVKAGITGNPDFGLTPGQSLYMTMAEMPRPGKDPNVPSYVSLFWDWWREDQSGVIFTEAEVATPPQHALSVIDYTTFERNAKIGPSDFEDPCNQGEPGDASDRPARRPPGHLNW